MINPCIRCRKNAQSIAHYALYLCPLEDLNQLTINSGFTGQHSNTREHGLSQPRPSQWLFLVQNVQPGEKASVLLFLWRELPNLSTCCFSPSWSGPWFWMLPFKDCLRSCWQQKQIALTSLALNLIFPVKDFNQKYNAVNYIFFQQLRFFVLVFQTNFCTWG